MNDPKWFWQATFADDSTVTFYADDKALAQDHAATLARDFNKAGVKTVTRLKHAKDVTPQENRAAGQLVNVRGVPQWGTWTEGE